MKLVIQTQFKENYGAHDWDGKGECPQHWKFKGGDTYVFPNLITNDITRIRESGIPMLTDLIESKSDYSEEYIIDWSFEDDNAVICEEWETPWQLIHKDSGWVASRRKYREDYWEPGVGGRDESYVMSIGGGREQYSNEYFNEVDAA